jgi:integrase
MRGSIRRRGQAWTLVVDLGIVPDPATGVLRRKQKFMSFLTQRKAQDALAKIITDLNKGEYIEPTKISVGTWISDWSKALEESPAVRPTTRARYRSVVARVIADAVLAPLPLQKLRPSHVEAFYNALAKELEPGTIRVYHNVLSKALKAAVKDKLLSRNVAAEADNKPRITRADRSRHARLECWTATEARTFLAVTDQAGSQVAAFYALALDSGARLRELAGLRWADVNLETGVLTISQQLLPGATTSPVWGPTKTKTERQLTLTPETITRLRKHKQAQAALKMAHRDRYQDEGLIFAKEHEHLYGAGAKLGQPLPVNNISDREFARLIKQAGVRRIKFHGLRHTTATLSLANGEPIHDIAARLGHSRTSITMDVYAHAEPLKAPTTIRSVLFG